MHNIRSDCSFIAHCTLWICVTWLDLNAQKYEFHNECIDNVRCIGYENDMNENKNVYSF